MTKNEVIELVEETILNHPKVSDDDRKRFKDLAKTYNLTQILRDSFNKLSLKPTDPQSLETMIEALGDYHVKDLLSFYGETRGKWRPPIMQSSAVREMIEEVITFINQESTGPAIQPLFFSHDFFSDDTKLRNETILQLRETCCVFIIDTI